MRPQGLIEDIPTFHIEVETVEPVPSVLRVKLVWAPDDEGESKTYSDLHQRISISPINNIY